MMLYRHCPPIPEDRMIRRTALVVPALALAFASGLAVAPASAAEPKNAQKVEIQVTKQGFVPDKVTVKAGAPVALHVTRKVERTCATEIVLKDFGVNQPLPLDKTVTVVVTPKKPGTYRFACGMDMIAGELRVQ
jgi:plastocyanin domain-containing protein